MKQWTFLLRLTVTVFTLHSHYVSETGSLLVFRWNWKRETLICWVRYKELVSVKEIGSATDLRWRRLFRTLFEPLFYSILRTLQSRIQLVIFYFLKCVIWYSRVTINDARRRKISSALGTRDTFIWGFLGDLRYVSCACKQNVLRLGKFIIDGLQLRRYECLS